MPASPALANFTRHLVAGLHQASLVRLHLSSPVPGATTLERVLGRLVQIRGESRLSLTLREPKRDTTLNLPLAEVEAWLHRQVPDVFRSAVLETTETNWQLLLSPQGRLRLATHRATTPSAPSRKHDASKPDLLGPTARPWLIQLGLCSADGRMRASMAGKARQLERFLELLSHLARDAGWKPGATITVADMGSGKGYLTFGAWHLLRHTCGLQAHVTGIETRADLVEKTNAVAQAIGAEGLQFTEGAIADAALPEPLDALIALHACNTATDDAIRRGLAARAKLIVVSPCCHQELRPQLGRPEPLAPLLAHGILAERFSEWLTDGLRALHLERAGYATKVMEFVPSEHTPRNLLIAAVRRDAPDAATRHRAEADIARLMAFAGIRRHALDSRRPRPQERTGVADESPQVEPDPPASVSGDGDASPTSVS